MDLLQGREEGLTAEALVLESQTIVSAQHLSPGMLGMCLLHQAASTKQKKPEHCVAIRDLLDEEDEMVREKVQFIFAVGKSVIGLVHQGSEEEAPSSDSDRGNSNQR